MLVPTTSINIDSNLNIKFVIEYVKREYSENKNRLKQNFGLILNIHLHYNICLIKLNKNCYVSNLQAAIFSLSKITVSIKSSNFINRTLKKRW